MKKAVIGVFILVLVLNLGALAKSRVVPGVYSTANGDFYTKFWKEMFKGGGPGQVGNTVMALGEGFIFN
jgi:hypothetical protein